MKNTPKNFKEDNAWDKRKLGASEKFVRKISKEREKAIDDRLNLQMISIRLQKKLLNQLKALADEDGIGYQPYIRQILSRHVRVILNNKKLEK